MTNTVKAADLIAKVREVAAGNPKFVYRDNTPNGDSQCYYFHPRTGVPSCLVGQGLALLGITADDLKGGLNDVSVFDLFTQDIITSSGIEEENWLSYAQGGQDIGYSWSRAVEGADRQAGTDSGAVL